MTTRIAFQLTGIAPLLMHADDVMSADALTAWRKDSSNKNLSVAGDDRSPAWTWQTYLYTDGQHVAIPSDNLMVCLRSAAAQVILKKQKTFKEISQSGMMVEEEFLDFTVGGGRKLPLADVETIKDDPFAAQAAWAQATGFRLFVKRARVGQSKHIRVRPRFDNWSASGIMLVTAPELTPDVVGRLFEIAGQVGLCDWRPGCKTPGPFGRFRAAVKVV